MGTVIVRLVAFACVTSARMVLTAATFSTSTGSKFVPVSVTALPTAATAGLNDAIVGAGAGVTVNDPAAVVDAVGVATVIAPDVAPTGTATRRRLGDADVTLACVPLK